MPHTADAEARLVAPAHRYTRPPDASARVWQVTWYFRTQFDTQIHRNTDAASPLQTEEDGALVNAMRYAKAKHNLTVAFTPFLDPFCNDYKVSPQRHGIPAAAWYPARHGILLGMVSPHGTVFRTPWGMVSRTA